MKLVDHLLEQLEAQGRKPYPVPLGGSDWLGTWGYLQAVQELVDQVGQGLFTDIVMVRHAPVHLLAVRLWLLANKKDPALPACCNSLASPDLTHDRKISELAARQQGVCRTRQMGV